MRCSGAAHARLSAGVLLVLVLLARGQGALSAESSDVRLSELELGYPGLSAQLHGCLASAGRALNEESAISALSAWLASAAPAAVEGFALILNPEEAVDGEDALRKDFDTTENCALTVFLDLISRGCVVPGDPITAALALANSNLFFLGDRETRQLIAEDVAAHFELYLEITAWQAAEGIPWSLAEVPLVPKVYWADRCRYQMGEILETLSPGNGHRMTAETYREFVDSPEVLRSLFEMAREEGLFSVSLVRTAGLLEDFVHRNRKYRSSMENLVDFHSRGMFSDEDLRLAREEFSRGEYERYVCGKMRLWDEFRWLNYQWRLYGEKGFFQFMPTKSGKTGYVESLMPDSCDDPFDRWCATITVVGYLGDLRCACIEEFGVDCNMDAIVASYGRDENHLVDPAVARQHRGARRGRERLQKGDPDVDEHWPIDSDDDFDLPL